MDNFLKTIGGGCLGSAALGMFMGPAGAVAGFGIGMFSSSNSMQGGSTLSNVLGGAGFGGLVGMATGNPFGGAIAGGATAGLISLIFGNNNQQQNCNGCQNYPQAPHHHQHNQGGNQGSYGYGYGQNGNYNTSLIGHPGYDMGSFNYGGGYGGNYGGGQSCACAGYYPQNQNYGGQQGYNNRPNYGGQLKGGDGKPIEYKTSGGYNVQINGGEITITDPKGEHKVVHSGDPHEYVDGKNVKDWDEKTRSLILGDGTKITMNAEGPKGVIDNYSIYDGAESIQVTAKGNKIDNVSFDPRQRQWADANQADGETAYMGYNNKGQFTYTDVYKQNENLGVTPYYKDIAGAGLKNNENQQAHRPHHHHRPQQYANQPDFNFNFNYANQNRYWA